MRTTETIALALMGAVLVTAPSLASPTRHASAPAVTFAGDAPEQPCPTDGLGDLAPSALAVEPVTDDGAQLELSVLLLVDGAPPADVQRIVAGATRAYEGIGVRLHITRRALRLAEDGRDADGQATVEGFAGIAQARRVRAPAGTDVVHVLTTKDVYVQTTARDSSDSIGGVAACVGGISTPGQEYSISESAFRFRQPSALDDVEAVIMAHEIGHVLGASHHFGNCAESRSKVPGDSGSCTVMWPVGILNAAVFGSVERAALRGYIRAYG